jgi:hypothetical protein
MFELGMKPHCLVARLLPPHIVLSFAAPTQESGTVESVAIVAALTLAHRLVVGTCVGQLVVGVVAVVVAVAVAVAVNCTVP